MPFRTKLDFSDNRQVKQHIETITALSGATQFGVPFSYLPTGPNLSTSGITNTYYNLVSNFSGNTGTTVYSWSDPRMSLGEPSFSALTPSNSATSQTTGVILTAATTATTVDGNFVVLSYSGVNFGIGVTAMNDLGGGNYSGNVTTTVLDILSADTLYFTGRTIWADISGITRTQDLIIANSPVIGYVWTCINSEGKGGWTPVSGTSSTANTYTTGATLIGTTAYFNRNDILSAYTLNLSALTSSGGSTYWSASTGTDSIVVNFSNSLASGQHSLAEGFQTTAQGDYSHAEGELTKAIGATSHAEGIITTASGNFSHAEGNSTTSSGSASHAEGNGSKAIGANGSHAEGQGTVASGQSSHSEGNNTTTLGAFAHAEGQRTTASGNSSHAEGRFTTANGDYSHAEGSGTTANGDYSHAEGLGNISNGITSHSEGGYLGASGPGPNNANGDSSHAEGWSTSATTDSAHAEGIQTLANASASHAEGSQTSALGTASHTEGSLTTATGVTAHAEGTSTTALGPYSHTEGGYTIATAEGAHAEGQQTSALDFTAHAEGFLSTAFGHISHAEGNQTTALGVYSHSGGFTCVASGQTSFVHGDTSIAGGKNTNVFGANITGTTDDTTYVDGLNIKTVGPGPGIRDLSVDANGYVVQSPSDVSLKTNINTITSALDKVKALRGVYFNWKNTASGGTDRKIGFIAQEVEKVVPELSYTDVSGIKSVHYKEVTALLVEAVKDLASGVTTSNNTHLETQTILAEDNNIELNYSGTQQTSIGGGIRVLHAMGQDLASEMVTDENGNWISNTDFKSKYLTIPIYSPTSSNDTNGNEGNITRDNNYLYVKTASGWKRSNLESF